MARDLSRARQRFEAEFRDDTLPAERRARAAGELGRHYHAYRLWSAAETCYRNARILDPEEPDWGYYLGVVLEMQGELQAADAVLSELQEDSTEVLLRRGRLKLEQGAAAEAAPLFRRVLARRESEAAAHAGLGRAHLATGDTEAARLHLERALQLQPGANSLHYFLAQAARTLDNPEEAARHLERQGRVEVGFSDPRLEGIRALAAGTGVDLRKGDAALLAGDPGAAIEAYRQAVEKAPADASAHHSLAAALASAGELEASVAEFRSALELDPDNPNLLIGLATSQLEMGLAEESLSTLRRALQQDPESLDARLQLAAAAERAGRPETALEAWEGVLARDAAHLGAMIGRARALAAVGRGREALRDLESIVAEYPGQLEARFELARLLVGAGRYSDAVPHYRRLVDESPANLQVRLLEVTALVLADRYDEARGRLETGIEELPDETELVHVLARLLATCPDERVRDGERALRLARDALDAENSLERAETVAMALAETGRFEDAVSWQEHLIGQARALGAQQALPRLAANLERYRRGEPAPPPWQEGS